MEHFDFPSPGLHRRLRLRPRRVAHRRVGLLHLGLCDPQSLRCRCWMGRGYFRPRAQPGSAQSLHVAAPRGPRPQRVRRRLALCLPRAFVSLRPRASRRKGKAKSFAPIPPLSHPPYLRPPLSILPYPDLLLKAEVRARGSRGTSCLLPASSLRSDHSSGIQLLLLPEPLSGQFPWGPWLSFYGIIILGSECAHDGRRCKPLFFVSLFSLRSCAFFLTFCLSIDASPSALVACADAAAAQILWFNVIKCTHADSWLLAGLAKLIAFDAVHDTLGSFHKESAAAAAYDLLTLSPIITLLRPGHAPGGFFPGAPLQPSKRPSRPPRPLVPLVHTSSQASATLRSGLTALGWQCVAWKYCSRAGGFSGA